MRRTHFERQIVLKEDADTLPAMICDSKFNLDSRMRMEIRPSVAQLRALFARFYELNPEQSPDNGWHGEGESGWERDVSVESRGGGEGCICLDEERVRVDGRGVRE